MSHIPFASITSFDDKSPVNTLLQGILGSTQAIQNLRAANLANKLREIRAQYLPQQTQANIASVNLANKLKEIRAQYLPQQTQENIASINLANKLKEIQAQYLPQQTQENIASINLANKLKEIQAQYLPQQIQENIAKSVASSKDNPYSGQFGQLLRAVNLIKTSKDPLVVQTAKNFLDNLRARNIYYGQFAGRTPVGKSAVEIAQMTGRGGITGIQDDEITAPIGTSISGQTIDKSTIDNQRTLDALRSEQQRRVEAPGAAQEYLAFKQLKDYLDKWKPFLTDINKFPQYSGYGGLAKIMENRVKIKLGDKVDPMFRQYESFQQIGKNIVIDALRKAMQTSTRPSYVTSRIAPIIDVIQHNSRSNPRQSVVDANNFYEWLNTYVDDLEQSLYKPLGQYDKNNQVQTSSQAQYDKNNQVQTSSQAQTVNIIPFNEWLNHARNIPQLKKYSNEQLREFYTQKLERIRDNV